MSTTYPAARIGKPRQPRLIWLWSDPEPNRPCGCAGSYRSRRSPDAGVPKLLKSLVDEGEVVEVDGRESVFFAPIVLGVLPFRLVAAFRQQVHGAHEIARIEVLGVDPT